MLYYVQEVRTHESTPVMTTATLAANIKQSIADDIRHCAPAHTRITMDVALANWAYFFDQGRYTEAKTWWAVVHSLMVAK
jgi:hypothetical protein